MPPEYENLEHFKTFMFEALRQTQKTKMEHGFNVCKEDGALKMSQMCKGDKCSVALPRCQWPKTFLEFHSHPPGHGVVMSPQDIYAALIDHSDYFCIGVSMGPRAKTATARCYKVNNDSPITGVFARAFMKYENTPSEDPEWQKSKKTMMDIIVGIIAGQSELMSKEIEWKEPL